MIRDQLSAAEARLLAVRASGIGAAAQPTVEEMLRKQVAIQLDSISALARAHQLTLTARLYDATAVDVDHALWTDQGPISFEYWVHAASLVPVSDWPLWTPRMQQMRRAEIDWRPEKSLRRQLLARVADRGPSTMTDLRADGESGKGWTWSPTKTAVEYLIWTGELVCVRRRRWKRLFDLPARAIPPELQADPPPAEESLRELVRRSCRAMGIATLADLADYLRTPETVLRPIAADAGLVAVTVAGWDEPGLAAPDDLDNLTPAHHAPRFVGPFDNLVWYRPRVQRLFGFHHVFEAYKPAAKRRYGYYVCPLLVDGELVGRADIATRAGACHLLSLQLNNSSDSAVAAAAAAASDLSRATNTGQVVLGEQIDGTLARKMRAVMDVAVPAE